MLVIWGPGSVHPVHVTLRAGHVEIVPTDASRSVGRVWAGVLGWTIVHVGGGGGAAHGSVWTGFVHVRLRSSSARNSAKKTKNI